MKSRRAASPVQMDFWPELNSRAMSFYSALATTRAPARSVSEDGRTGGGNAAPRSPLGIYGENAVTLSKKGRA